MKKLLLLIGILILTLGCSPEPEIVYKEIIVTATPLPEATATPFPTATPIPTAAPTQVPPTATPVSSTPTPIPTATSIPKPTPTFTAIEKYQLELAKAYKEASEKIPPTSNSGFTARQLELERAASGISNNDPDMSSSGPNLRYD